MEKAKFELDFVAGTDFSVDRELKVELPDGSTIVFYESKENNHGKIIFVIDRPDESYAKHEGKQKIDQFMNCLLIAKNNLENLRPTHFPQKPRLLNPDDFKGVIKTCYVEQSVNCYIVQNLEQQTLDETANLNNQISSMQHEELKKILRSLHWFRKASEIEGEDKFIFCWISFEQLLALLNKEESIQNLIPEFIDRFLETEISRKIFQKNKSTIEKLALANLVGWKNVQYSEMLKKSIQESNDARAVMPKAVLCIYEVRNRLFHKGETLELIQGCISLLRDVIRECLKFYVSK